MVAPQTRTGKNRITKCKRGGCKEAHPLSSSYPLQGSSGETVLQLQVSKSSFSADASWPCSTKFVFCQAHGQAKPTQKLFTGATLFQAPKSLWPSFSQPYWAHFSVLLPPELNAVVSGDLSQIYSLFNWFQWCPPWTTLTVSIPSHYYGESASRKISSAALHTAYRQSSCSRVGQQS